MMYMINDLNRNILNLHGERLLLQFSSVKGLYEKYGNLIICFNFVILSYSVISLILLLRVFESVQENCRGYTLTFSLNLLCLTAYLIASVLIGIAVKRRSSKYFRKYLILLALCLLVKIAQFAFFLFAVRGLLNERREECADVSLIEEKEATFFMDFVAFCFALYITLKLRGLLLAMSEINKRLEEIGIEREHPDPFDSED